MPRALAPALVLVAALALLWLARPSEPEGGFDTDEAEWLTISAAHFQQALGNGDPWRGLPAAPPEERATSPWCAGIHASTFGAINPALPKLVLGAALHAAGVRQWDARVYRRVTRVKEHKLAAREVVRAGLGPGRTVARALGAVCAALLFVCARHLAGSAAGVAAAALWLAAPLVRTAADRVATDLFPLASALAALAVALACAPALCGARGRARQALAALALGACAGLALGSKLNGALVVVFAALAAPLAWTARPDERGSLGAALAASAIAVIAAGATFLALMPGLWGPPAGLVGRAAELLELWRADTLQRQSEARAGVAVAHTLAQRLALGLRGGLARHEPLAALTGLPIGLALAALGLVTLARGARRAALLALAFVLVHVLATAAWIPLDWERYYLPIVAAAVLLEGVGLGAVVAALARRRRARNGA